MPTGRAENGMLYLVLFLRRVQVLITCCVSKVDSGGVDGSGARIVIKVLLVG